MKKILLIGHAGFLNRGCEAIVRGTVEIIKQYVPDTQITLISRTPGNDLKTIQGCKIAVNEVVPAILNGHKKPSLQWMWQTIDRRLLSGNPEFQDYLHKKYFQEADVVISIGGDNFSEDYRGPRPYFESLRYAKRLGKKTVIWGASVGPFKDAGRWINILKSCDLITAREDKTVDYLASIGCTENVKRVSDPAFCMLPIKPEGYNIEKKDGRLLIGLGISDLIPRYHISREQYYKINIEFIEYLAKQYKGDIVLVPHVIYPDNKYCDDSRACNEVIDLLCSRDCCRMLPNNLNAAEMKYCISQCDYFIGARTHSTIASLSTTVPTGSIGYSVKAVGINLDLLGSEDYVLSHSNLSLEKMIGLFEKMQKNRSEIVSQLQKEVPHAKERAFKAGQYLAEIIG